MDSIFSFLQSTGTIGYVMAGLSLIAMTLFIARALWLVILLRKPWSPATRTQVQDHCRQCFIQGPSESPQTVVSFLKPYGDFFRIASIRNRESSENLERRLQTEASMVSAGYRAGAGFISLVAQTACLLGFMGTVSGMIRTFAVIASTGSSNPVDLAAGISEALGTTLLGLVIAVPSLMAHSFFIWLVSIADLRLEFLCNTLAAEQESSLPGEIS